jgi:hypothetical protein
MPDETKPPQKGWGIHITVPQGELSDEQASKLQDSVNKLMPHLVEAVANVHGIDASNCTPKITRGNPPR